MIQHEMPTTVWNKLGMDFFDLNGQKYLAIVDYASKFPFIQPVRSTSAKETINILQAIWDLEGLPETIISDNGPPFNSQEFASFCKKDDITHTTSSPTFAQSNGLIERNIQTFKTQMTKLILSGQHPLEVLKQIRSQPLGKDLPSPAELLHQRPLQKKKHNTMTLQETQKILQKKKDEGEKNFNKRHRSTSLSTLVEGELVLFKYVSPANKSTWEDAVVQRVCKEPNSYEIKTKNGSVLRRNRRDLQSKGIRKQPNRDNRRNHHSPPRAPPRPRDNSPPRRRDEAPYRRITRSQTVKFQRQREVIWEPILTMEEPIRPPRPPPGPPIMRRLTVPLVRVRIPPPPFLRDPTPSSSEDEKEEEKEEEKREEEEEPGDSGENDEPEEPEDPVSEDSQDEKERTHQERIQKRQERIHEDQEHQEHTESEDDEVLQLTEAEEDQKKERIKVQFQTPPRNREKDEEDEEDEESEDSGDDFMTPREKHNITLSPQALPLSPHHRIGTPIPGSSGPNFQELSAALQDLASSASETEHPKKSTSPNSAPPSKHTSPTIEESTSNKDSSPSPSPKKKQKFPTKTSNTPPSTPELRRVQQNMKVKKPVQRSADRDIVDNCSPGALQRPRGTRSSQHSTRQKNYNKNRRLSDSPIPTRKVKSPTHQRSSSLSEDELTGMKTSYQSGKDKFSKQK
jgi:hypothetical protein